MKFFCQPNLLSFCIALISLQINAQNTISIKKSSTTIDAIFIYSSKETKLNQYYCFKKSGYVYYFTSSLKKKKIIRYCQGQQWLKLNSVKGKYFHYQNSIKISPITYSMYEEETVNDFYYLATLDSAGLSISAMGIEDKKKFNLLFPK